MAQASKKAEVKTATETQIKDVCGIVMPISAIDGCSESHWGEVMEIISESIADAGLASNIVSNADEVGIIQKRIIQNLYENPIVVCDVSGKNPNVMFELGLRLAFDKPTIIIKDDKTSYSFDTSPIEHLEYPRDLRFSAIVDFKEKLSEKITKTLAASKSNADYSTFLKHFGEFKVAKISSKQVSEQEFILDEIKNLRSLIESSNKRQLFTGGNSTVKTRIEICCKDERINKIKQLEKLLILNPGVKEVRVRTIGSGEDHYHITVYPSDISKRNILRSEIKEFIGDKYRVIIHP